MQPIPKLKVSNTDRVHIATKAAAIAVGRRRFSVSGIMVPSAINIAGVIMALRTAIGTKRMARTHKSGISRGNNPESGANRMLKVNKPHRMIQSQMIMTRALLHNRKE